MTFQSTSDQSFFSEIRQYISMLQKWAWLLVLTTILGAVGMYFYDRQQTPLYQASTKVVIAEPLNTQRTELSLYMGTNRWLVNTYAELFTTQPILESVIQHLGLEVGAGYLKARVSVDASIESGLVTLKVQDIDPERAALIANTLVEQFNVQNEQLLLSRYISAEENLQAQIDSVEEQITRLSKEIAEEQQQQQQQQLAQIEIRISELENSIIDLQGEITELKIILGVIELGDGDSIYTTVDPSDAGRVSVLKAKELELSQLQASLSLYQNIYYELTITGSRTDINQNDNFDQRQTSLELYQQTYQNLLSDYEKINLARLENESNVVQVEPARPTRHPISPRIMQDVSYAAIFGLIVGIGIAFLIEILDDSIKNPEDITSRVGISILGNIA